MGNYQRLLDEEYSGFEVVGYAENLSGIGTRVRDMEPRQARQAYTAAGEFLHSRIAQGRDLSGGDLLMYESTKDRWATLSFVVSDSVRIERVTDTI